MFEDDFITCGEMLIKEIGAWEYLRRLLENLKGNNVPANNDAEVVHGDKLI